MRNAIILPLDSVATFKSGGTPRKSNTEYWAGNLPWVSAKDLKSPIIIDSINHLSSAGFAVASVAPSGSLLVLVRGMTLHKDVPVCLAERDVAFNQDIKALILSEKVFPKYLLYFLRANKNRLLGLVDSAGHGTGRLNTDSLRSFPVLVPPLPEQTAIANLLSTWDTAIEKTEKLIAAKQEQRKGLMQQLLSGKKQFPGFTKPWQEVRLSNVFKRVTRKNSADVTHVLTASGEHGLIDQKDYFNRSVSGRSLKGYYHLRHGEFAYNRSAMKGYPYGAIKRLDFYTEGVLSTLYLCFKLSSRNQSSDFFMHYFEAGNLNRQLRRIAQVGARAHGLLNVTTGDFFNLKLKIPGLDEQKRIACFLNNFDREISLLQKKLNAYGEQKRGLMQKLLTGEWLTKPLEFGNEQ